MRQLSIREVRAQLPHLDRLVSRGDGFVITRRGKPIARLVPVAGTRKRPSHADLRARMPRLRRGSEALVRADRDTR